MDTTALLGAFLGIDWNFWKYLGWLGNAVFFSRFLVQWWATEKSKQVVIPNAFWYLSLAGSLILLAYSIHKRDSVFIFAYLFTWIPYIRNLMISHRTKKMHSSCAECRMAAPENARFCPGCGAEMAPLTVME